MGINKEAKEEIIRMMILEIPTEEIAARLNYSIGTVRNVFEELREEYGVNSKVGLAVAYFREKIKALNSITESILRIGCQITPNPKPSPYEAKRRKKSKKRKKKNT